MRLAQGERIEIRGFGSFSLHFRPPRLGRNPKTGDSVALPGKYVPHFKPGKELRDRVNASPAPSAVLSFRPSWAKLAATRPLESPRMRLISHHRPAVRRHRRAVRRAQPHAGRASTWASPASNVPAWAAILLAAVLLGALVGGTGADRGVVCAAAGASCAAFRRRTSPRPRNTMSELALAVPAAADRRRPGWLIGRRGGERRGGARMSRLSQHLFPRPELPAERAAGQGDRGLPADRRSRQGHLRNPVRARAPVPPPRRGRSRHPPAPEPGRAAPA